MKTATPTPKTPVKAPRPKRKKSTGSSRVYSYVAKIPKGSPTHTALMNQLRLAHRYRNTLIELERTRRAKVEELLARLSPRLVAVDKALEEVNAAVTAAVDEKKAANANAKKKVRQPELSQRIKDLKAQRKKLYDERKDLRKSLFGSSEWEGQSKQIEEEASQALRDARGEISKAGLFWGTYNMVEEAMRAIRKGAPPTFKGWARDPWRKVGIQTARNPSPDKIMSGTSNWLRITPGRVEAPGSRRPRKLGDALAHMRIGSNPDRTPLWAEIPFFLTRPLFGLGGDTTTVRFASVVRKVVGKHEKWSFQVVLRDERKDAFARPDSAAEGAVGIDVGWRLFPDRLRVAVLAGSDGRELELALPRWWLEEMKKVERIRGHQDKHRDEFLPRLLAWRASHGPLSEDLEKLGKAMHQWRSTRRLSGWVLRLVKELEQDVDKHCEILKLANAWRAREEHLNDYQSHLRDQLFAIRKDLYRNFARRLARSYRTAYVEQIDLRAFSTLPEEGSDEGRVAGVTSCRRSASTSIFLQCVKEAMTHHEEKPAEYTTVACHACGVRDLEWKKREELVHTCSNCGATWDQDVNAARNLLGEVQGAPVPGSEAHLELVTLPTRKSLRGANEVPRG